LNTWNNLEHTYGFGPEFERVMIYYDKARLDGLAKRHETILELTDYFVNRDDFLEYRKAVFEPRPKKFGPADKDTQRPIIVITKILFFVKFLSYFSIFTVNNRTICSKFPIKG
jgi:hypothetical protein